MIAEIGVSTFMKGSKNEVMKIANAMTRAFVQKRPLDGDGFSPPRFIFKTFIIYALFRYAKLLNYLLASK